jgi:hypothetical protein
MLQIVVDIQRDIYLALAEHIKAFAVGGGWAAFRAFLTLGIVFGAVHALTPRHRKSILASYLTGWRCSSPGSRWPWSRACSAVPGTCPRSKTSPGACSV